MPQEAVCLPRRFDRASAPRLKAEEIIYKLRLRPCVVGCLQCCAQHANVCRENYCAACRATCVGVYSCAHSSIRVAPRRAAVTVSARLWACDVAACDALMRMCAYVVCWRVSSSAREAHFAQSHAVGNVHPKCEYLPISSRFRTQPQRPGPGGWAKSKATRRGDEVRTTAGMLRQAYRVACRRQESVICARTESGRYNITLPP